MVSRVRERNFRTVTGHAMRVRVHIVKGEYRDYDDDPSCHKSK